MASFSISAFLLASFLSRIPWMTFDIGFGGVRECHRRCRLLLGGGARGAGSSREDGGGGGGGEFVCWTYGCIGEDFVFGENFGEFFRDDNSGVDVFFDDLVGDVFGDVFGELLLGDVLGGENFGVGDFLFNLVGISDP
jgi:hypothetical protein